MEFRFNACGCPTGSWQEQVADALQTHTELRSRSAHPDIWKVTDRIEQAPKAADSALRKRQRRRKLQGAAFWVMGLFLIIPGLMKPEELALPLLVGVFTAIAGIVRLLPRRKPSRKRFLKSAAFLLKQRSTVQATTVVFTEEGMSVSESSPVPYADFLSVIEAKDLYLVTWADQVILLFKQELQDLSTEEFSPWLSEKTAVAAAKTDKP